MLNRVYINLNIFDKNIYRYNSLLGYLECLHVNKVTFKLNNMVTINIEMIENHKVD